MIAATQIRKGMVLLYKGEPHSVLDFEHRAPGKGAAFVRVRLRNLVTGASYEHRFASGETVERIIVDQQEMEYLYRDGNLLYFMNTETFEQIPLDEKVLKGCIPFLKEGTRVQVQFHGGRALGVEMPTVVELAVSRTEPELKGATAANSPKPATLETGAVIQVPPFIREGDVVRVDPESGTYLERAK